MEALHKTRRLVKAVLLMGVCGLLMGNESCQKKPPVEEGRMLRRRVQMGKITAPEIELPEQLGRKKFDFAYVANAQMYDILRKTQSFSTATIDPNETWNPDGLGNQEKDRFNSCGDDGDLEVENYNYWTNAKISTISRDAACMIYMPQAIIHGSIKDFTLYDSKGLSLGLAGIPVFEGLEFTMNRYLISIELRAKHPLEIGDHYFSTVSLDKWQKDGGFAAKFVLGDLKFGPKYYFRTPLAKIVDDSFTEGIKKLRDNWSADEPWYSMVMKNCDKYIYINGGYGNDAGLKENDIVKIVNVKYIWEGEACESRLHSDMAAETVAYARIKHVGRNISEAWIIQDDNVNYPWKRVKIYPGSRVYMEKMVEQTIAEEQKLAQQKLEEQSKANGGVKTRTPASQAPPKKTYGRQ